MKSRITACIIFILLGGWTLLFGQTPQAFKYQAIARDGAGLVLASTPIHFQISILEGSDTGPSVYTETQLVTTNAFGLANLEIGSGLVVSGVFSSIDWATNSYFLQVEMDETGGTAFTLMGSAQLLSVPYALHATTSGSSSTDMDTDSTNEIQSLSLAGNELSISDGNTITLTDNVDDADADTTNELQILSISSDTLYLSDGGMVYLGGYLDTDDQTLSISGSDLSISDGNTVTLTDNVDDADADTTNELQVLSFSGDTLYLSDGGMVYLGGYLNTDGQTLSISGSDLSISGGNTITLTDNVDDADADPANELQILSYSGDTLYLSNGGNVYLGSLGGVDGDWTVSGTDMYAGVSGNVGIGTTTPDRKLHVFNAGTTKVEIEGQDTSTSGLNGNAALILTNSDPTVGNSSELIFHNGTSTASQINSFFTDRANHYGTLDFWTRGTDGFNQRMTITEEGDVGIGDVASGTKLLVSSPASATGQFVSSHTWQSSFKLSNSSSSTTYQLNVGGATNGDIGAGSFGIFEGGDYRFVIKDTGNVGIGTVNPASKLHVFGEIRTESMPGAGEFLTTYDGSGNKKVSFSNNNAPTVSELNVNVYPGTSTAGAHVRFFRDLNTTGFKRVTFFNGNGTTQSSASIGSDGADSYFQVFGGNLGIGTSTPSATLDVVGNLQLLDGTQGSGKVLTSDASGNASWQTPTGGSTDGDWTISGVDQYSAVSGRVGVGNPTPNAKLHVLTDGTTSGLKVNATDSIGFGLPFWIEANTNGATFGTETHGRLMRLGDNRVGAGFFDIGIDENNSFFISNNGTTTKALVLEQGSGNIGIGTTTPSDKLHVAGTGFFSDVLTLKPANDMTTTSITTAGDIGLLASDDIYLRTGSTATEQISFQNSSGTTVGYFDMESERLGIGTSSPTGKVHIDGDDNDGSNAALKIQAGTQVMLLDGNEIDAIAAGTELHFNNNTPNPVVMTMGGGNVGVGIAAPVDKLHVLGPIRCEEGPYYARITAAAVSGPIMLLGDNLGTEYMRVGSFASINNIDNKDRDLHIFSNSATTGTYFKEATGFVGIGTASPTQKLSVNGEANKPGGGSWLVFSDSRLKKNIQPYRDGLTTLSKIKPITFQYNGKAGITNTDKEYVGIIAQEIQEVAPYMVNEIKYHNPTSGATEEYLEFDPNALNFMLINSVQELMKRVETLEAEVTELRKK